METSSSRRLRLRPVRDTDENSVRAAQVAMQADNFSFALESFDPDGDFAGYVTRVAEIARGIGIAAGRVAATYLVAELDGEIVGRSSVRHCLNDLLRREGGHIGYCVLPGHRRRGYATEILRQSLIVARSLGVERALLVCNEDNVGSAAVIEANGGVLEWTGPAADGHRIRRYWID